MKRVLVVALLLGAALAHAQTKKELAQKIVQLQQAGIEGVARNLVQQPATLMLQEVDRTLRTQVPEERRAGIVATINAATKKYFDEAFPPLRERALKLAPAAFGAPLEEKLSEDELKQVIAWMESPASKKFQQVTAESQNGFVQALVADARPVIDPKVAALEQSIRAAFQAGAAPGAASAPAAGASRPRAAAPAKAASK
jgi:uncharacterized protein